MAEPESSGRWLVYGVISTAELGNSGELQLDPGLRGAFGQLCTVLSVAPLAAIVGLLPAEPSLAQPATADLLAYAKVIAHVHARQTIVPLRFGGVLDGEAGVRAHLMENAARYQELLDRLRGTEELAVRVGLSVPEPPATPGPPSATAGAGTGAAYLRARQARYAQAERRQAAAKTRAEWLCAALMPYALLHHIETIDDGNELAVAAAFLIRRGTAAELRARAQELAAGEPVRLTVSGPFPPYSFAELSPSAAAPSSDSSSHSQT